MNHPQTNRKLERFWREYDRHRWRYATLEEFIERHNDQIHESLWVEIHETPREAWQRKMPVETQLGQFLRRVEGTEALTPPATPLLQVEELITGLYTDPNPFVVACPRQGTTGVLGPRAQAQPAFRPELGL